MVTEHMITAPPGVIFQAWTKKFDGWFVGPGSFLTKPQANAAEVERQAAPNCPR